MVARTLYLILIICYCCSTTSCKKKKSTLPIDELPPITQTGENTFGCLMNGDAVYTTLYSSQLAGEGVEYYLSPDSNLAIYSITKTNGKRIDWNMRLQYSGSLTKTYNKLNVDSLIFSVNLNPDGTGPPNAAYYYDSGPFEINITKFSGNQYIGGLEGDVLSGTFNINLINVKGDTLRMTNGRFDIKKQ